jgi:hypothetical protein
VGKKEVEKLRRCEGESELIVNFRFWIAEVGKTVKRRGYGAWCEKLKRTSGAWRQREGKLRFNV